MLAICLVNRSGGSTRLTEIRMNHQGLLHNPFIPIGTPDKKNDICLAGQMKIQIVHGAERLQNCRDVSDNAHRGLGFVTPRLRFHV